MSNDDGRGDEEPRRDEAVEFPGRSPSGSLRIALLLAVALMLLAVAAIVVNYV